jgi:prolyl 4-hydroxylase
MNYGLEKDKRNFNFFTSKPKLELTGPLMATVILYLSSDTQGGQIVFPESVVWPFLFVLCVLV